MTEYDYSPEAYERHVRKQQAIARWVDDTNLHTPANPFIPLPETPSPTAYRSQDRGPGVDYERWSSSRQSHSDAQDSGHRSRHGRHDRHRSRKHSAPTPASYNYSSQPTYRPGIQRQATYDARQHQYYSAATQPYNSPHDSSSRTPTASPPPHSGPQSHPSQQVVIPIRDGTGGYFFNPQKGVTYQIIHPQSPSPSAAAQPWYKRVFSSAADSNDGKHKLSKTHHHGSRRSSKSRWSLDIY